MPNYDLIPQSLVGGVKRWIKYGIDPGSFLAAVIRNDLQGAFAHADDGNQSQMFDIVKWWYNEAPSACWGSQAKADEWAKSHEAAREQATAEGRRVG